MQYREITLENWSKKGEGATSEVFVNVKDESMILKLFKVYVPFESIKEEFDKSVAIQEMNIPTPAAYSLVRVNGRCGILYERVKNKISISRAIADNPEKMAEYISLFASLCKDLHKTPCSTKVFAPAKDLLNECIDLETGLDETEKRRARNFVHRLKDENTCLHLDMHIGNVILSGDKPYWIDLGGFSYGDHLLDVSIFYFLMWMRSESAFAQETFHLNTLQLRKCWELFFDEYFDHPGKEEASVLLEKIKSYTLLFILFARNKLGIKVPEDLGVLKNMIAQYCDD